jgi:hypothetical protein
MDLNGSFLVKRGRGYDCEAARPRLQQAAQPTASTRAESKSWRVPRQQRVR